MTLLNGLVLGVLLSHISLPSFHLSQCLSYFLLSSLLPLLLTRGIDFEHEFFVRPADIKDLAGVIVGEIPPSKP